MKAEKPIVLLFTDWYLPGYKAGGPIQSCVNLVRTLSAEFSFWVITSDRDLGSLSPYEKVPRNQWTTGPFGEKLFYAAPGFINRKWLRQLFSTHAGSTIYLNSMFSLPFTLLPVLVARKFPANRLVLAPRGMLHPGALGLKSGKKKIFLRLLRLLGWHKRILFQATTEEEAGYIQQHFPGAAMKMAGNIPSFREQKPPTSEKQPGMVKLVFVGRIHPTKNLDLILNLLHQAGTARILLELIGEPGPPDYVEECCKLIKQLPSNIEVKQFGSMPHQESFTKLLESHALVLPSLGENFGHAIFEALISGKPVLISNRTPWRNLEQQQAGWDLSLENPEGFAAAIEQLAAMNQETYHHWSEGAYRLANNYFGDAAYNRNYRELFT